MVSKEALIVSPVFKDKKQFAKWLIEYAAVIQFALRGSERLVEAMKGYPPYYEYKNSIKVTRWSNDHPGILTTVYVDRYYRGRAWDVRVRMPVDETLPWYLVHEGNFDRIVINPDQEGLILVEENDLRKREYLIHPNGTVTMTAAPKIAPANA